MNRRGRVLFAALILLGTSGLMLHLRIHFFMVPGPAGPASLVFDPSRFMATLLPLTDVLIVTALFTTRKTAVYGYLLNDMIVILGTVLMGHFNLAALAAKPVPWPQALMTSTLPDIGIAWADFFAGKALYDIYQGG